ncbi:MAG TPA: hypothetical protein VFA37_09595 [Gaiellaceae bacterium]|nr:hypothetical protein [Gaiellaceae bacterium]
MTRARLIGLAAVVLAAATAAVVVLLPRSAGAGPLGWPNDVGTSWSGLPVKRGQIAVTTLDLHQANSPAVLLDVRPLHPADADGLTIRYAATTGKGLEIGGARGWNAKAWQLHRLAGFVIPAHARAGIAVGASATKRGVYFLHAFVVDYRIGGTHYSAPLYQGLEVCVARGCPNGG